MFLKTLSLIIPLALSSATSLYAQGATIVEGVTSKLNTGSASGADQNSAKYQLQPGNVLLLEVLEDPTLTRSLLIAPDGRITVPMAGTIKVSGLTLEQAETKIVNALKSSFALTPNVILSLNVIGVPEENSTGTITVFILGEVGSPGQMKVQSGTTLLQVLASIGGFSKFAAPNRIQLRRTGAGGKEEIFVIDYRRILDGSSSAGQSVLKEGDILLVPERGLFEF